MIDWLRRMLGNDLVFAPHAQLARLSAELEQERKLAAFRRSLLVQASQPHASDAAERAVQRRIRHHLEHDHD